MNQEEWKGTIEVVDIEELHEEKLRKPRRWLLLFFASLVVTFAAYGMANNDPGLLGDVFELVRHAMMLILGWVFGRQRPP